MTEYFDGMLGRDSDQTRRDLPSIDSTQDPIVRTEEERRAVYDEITDQRGWKSDEIRPFQRPLGFENATSFDFTTLKSLTLPERCNLTRVVGKNERESVGSYYQKLRDQAFDLYIRKLGLKAGDTFVLGTTGGGGDLVSTVDPTRSFSRRGINVVICGISLKRRSESDRVGCIPMSEYRKEVNGERIRTVHGSDDLIGVIEGDNVWRQGEPHDRREVESIILQHLKEITKHDGTNMTALVADFSQGPAAIARAFEAVRREYNAKHMAFLDVGGDAIAYGPDPDGTMREPGLESEVLDTFGVKAASILGADIFVTALGADGEISLFESLKQLDAIIADGGFHTYFGYSYNDIVDLKTLVEIAKGKTETSLVGPRVFGDLVAGKLPGLYSGNTSMSLYPHTPNGDTETLRELYIKDDTSGHKKATIEMLAENQRSWLEIALNRGLDDPLGLILKGMNTVSRLKLRGGTRTGDTTLCFTPGTLVLDGQTVARNSQLVQECPENTTFEAYSEALIAGYGNRKPAVVEKVNVV